MGHFSDLSSNTPLFLKKTMTLVGITMVLRYDGGPQKAFSTIGYRLVLNGSLQYGSRHIIDYHTGKKTHFLQ